MGYVHIAYKPKKTELITEYYLEPATKKVMEAVAGESSIGTWTDISTMKPRIAKKLAPKVFYKKGGHIKIAYPAELFEAGNMPEILSSIAGNIFGMKALKNLRLEDILFPKSIVNKFKGPKYGIKGIRKLLKVKKRPLCGTIIKPKVGLNAKEHAQVAYEAWKGGIDIVKDDENLSSMTFNNFYKRVTETVKMKKKAEKETNEKKIYMPNVTAEANEMLKRARFVKQQGNEYIMVDILTVGWSALQTLRDANLGLVLHAHRAMHGALTRNPKHGISMKAIARCARLIGVDQLHIGTAVGKMQGSREEIIDINKALTGNMFSLKQVFPVASGGLHPGLVDKLTKALGTNIIIQMGGGCHGHPGGTEKGATAIRQAIDAVMKGISLKKYAESHSELKSALDTWS